MRKLRSAVLLIAVLAGTAASNAQVYPSRPITMVVPYSAGGPTDTIARIMAERMRAPARSNYHRRERDRGCRHAGRR